MKDFAEAYKAASAKAREYQGAKRAGWAEPGKRTRENHAILIPRWEAVDMPGMWRHVPRWVDEWEMPIL